MHSGSLHKTISPSERFHILIFFNHCPMPGFRGGSDLFPVRLIRYSPKGLVSFEIVTSKAGCTLLQQEGIKQSRSVLIRVVKTLGAEKIPLGSEYLLRLIEAMAFALRVNPRKYTAVVSASDWGFFDAIPAFLMKLRNKQLVWVSVCWHLINGPFSRRGRSAISSLVPFLSQKLMLRMVKQCGDIVLTETKVIVNMLHQAGISASKTRIVQGALDPETLSEIPEQDLKYDAAFVGRLHPEKGILDAIKTWKLVCGRFPNSRLAVVGSATPNWVEHVKKKIADADLSDNIVLLGYLPDREKYCALKASQMFLHLSFEDGLPITVCEAMACGVPVVAYELPTYADGWMNAPFIRVPVGDVRAFADAVTQLLNDSKLRARLANSARSIAAQYGWDKMAVTVIEAVLEKSREKARGS